MRFGLLSGVAGLLLWVPGLLMVLGFTMWFVLPEPWSDAAIAVTGMMGLAYYYGIILVRAV